MTRQLNLDRDKIEYCYDLSSQIVSHAAKYIDRHSSPAVERATLILLGVDGTYRGQSLASLMVGKLTKDQLRMGIANWWGRALFASKEEPNVLAEKLARGKIKWSDLPEAPPSEIRKRTTQLAEAGFQKWSDLRKKQDLLLRFETVRPALGVQFQESKPKKIPQLAEQWREKGIVFQIAKLQSRDFLKEEFPVESLKIAWGSLASSKTVVVAEGLSLPEQTLLAMEAGLPAVVLDALVPILKGEIDAKRSLIDQSFALSLCSVFPMQILNLPVDLKGPQLLAHLLIYEQLARRQGVSFEKVMLSFYPAQEKGLIASLSFAQVLREMFSKSPLWYSLPEKPDPFSLITARVADLDVVLSLASSEIATQTALWLKETEGLSDALVVNTHGRIGREAHLLLDQTWKTLRHMHQATLWKALEDMALAPATQAVGGEGVFQKSFHYWNPVSKLLEVEV
ncbi:MAG: hypothetical protein A3H42_04190 [Deltaproteobacteria bacterium RIFCSPLOWO2_02_FULL_46_8]|nr:MAG: hypothetical protein A3H42_04190 [Deltaproteobacteria bacterium RIFCSPLOWO2_02_FULL_46_8]